MLVCLFVGFFLSFFLSLIYSFFLSFFLSFFHFLYRILFVCWLVGLFVCLSLSFFLFFLSLTFLYKILFLCFFVFFFVFSFFLSFFLFIFSSKLELKFFLQLVCCPVGWICRIYKLHRCREVRPPPTTTSVLDMTLNNLMASQSNVGAKENIEYSFIAIVPRSTLARSGSTW